MVKRSVNGELSFQNFAVNHSYEGGTEIISDLNKLTTFDLHVIFNWLSLLTLQVLVLLVERSIESGLESV